VVVRYFGGTKLGVGGLINAYRTSAKLILDEAKISIKTVDVNFKLVFEYADMNKVMRIIKENKVKIESQQMYTNCEFIISVRKNDASKVFNSFTDLRCLKIKQLTM
jgi:putative IMPACT (imprinted ancient) family translation regulator